MANQVAKFSEAGMPTPPSVTDFITGVARAMAAKEKPAAVSDVGLGALTNLFNGTNTVETERFQYSPTAAQMC